MDSHKKEYLKNNADRSLEANKILENLHKIYEDLLAYKKRMNSVLVFSENGKIVRVKP